MAILLGKQRLALAIGMFLLSGMDQEEGLGTRVCAAAATGAHHVVGGDPGWDAASNIPARSVNRIFRVGDTIWFAYLATDDGIVEVGSKEEFESCEVGNPIRRYTEGLNRRSLDEEGSRYFASADPVKCKNGLKLHVKVRPPAQELAVEVTGSIAGAVAQGPMPSRSNCLRGTASLVLIVLALVSSTCFWEL